MKPAAFVRSLAAALFHRSGFDQDLDDELRAHIQNRAADLARDGLAPAEALRRARLEFGALDKAKEQCREALGVHFLHTLAQDLRYAARTLRKSPGFAAVAILTLALGIGANTAIFSVVNGILLEPLPYAGSSRLVTIGGLSLPASRDVQAQCTAFQRFAVYEGGYAVTIRTGLMPDTVGTAQVSSDFFPMLGVQPLLGRPILRADTESNAEPVAVLAYKLWQDDFGGASAVLGRTLFVGDKPLEIVGVMARDFDLAAGDKGFWTPLRSEPPQPSAPPAPKASPAKTTKPEKPAEANRDFRVYSAVARLREGVTLEQANAQLKTFSARLAAEYPAAEKGNELVAKSVKDEMVSEIRPSLLILLGAVAFVLLIACVNVSALLVARAWTRQKEVTIRKALGATRLRLIRQFLAESALLAIVGGALGLLFSVWGIRLLRAIAPPGTPRLDRIHLDGNVLAFTLGISILAAILFGLAPALQASSRRMGGSLKEGLGGSFAGVSLRRQHYLRTALLIVEVSLAVVLVIGAALMVRSFEKLIHVNTGLRTGHLLTFQVSFTGDACNSGATDKCRLLYLEALRQIRSLNGVQAAAVSQGVPMLGGGYVDGLSLYLEGSRKDQLNDDTPLLWEHSITPGYFDALGIRLLQGRDFDSSDTGKSPPVAIVNQSFARTYLSGRALGKRFAVNKDKDGHPIWIQIVGVASDDRDLGLQDKPGPLYYRPYGQGWGWQGDFLVRTASDPMAMASAIRREVWSVDKDAPITTLETLDQKIAGTVAKPRFLTAILGSFGALGLLLAAVGIYGVISYSVVQRTHEIGIRMALGARPRDVLRLVVGQGARLALIGIAFGLGAAWGLTRLLRSFLFELKPADPLTFAAVAILLLAVALLACYIPARRAMRVDPTTAMRCE